MGQRGSIPVLYWPRIVRAAKDAGKPIDNDALVRAHLSEAASIFSAEEAEAKVPPAVHGRQMVELTEGPRR